AFGGMSKPKVLTLRRSLLSESETLADCPSRLRAPTTLFQGGRPLPDETFSATDPVLDTTGQFAVGDGNVGEGTGGEGEGAGAGTVSSFFGGLSSRGPSEAGTLFGLSAFSDMSSRTRRLHPVSDK